MRYWATQPTKSRPKRLLTEPYTGVSESDQPDDLPLALRRSAMNLLARREHSRRELTDKLGSRYRDIDPAQLESALNLTLDRLEADGLLSELRFTEAYIHSRIGRGFGPLSIRYDLRQRGVDDESIQALLPADDEFWVEQLAQVLRRKYDADTLASREPRTVQKVQRFVISRGFSSSHWSQWRRS